MQPEPADTRMASRRSVVLTVLAAWAVLGSPTLGQHPAGHDDGVVDAVSGVKTATSGALLQPGQAIFGALHEVLERLEADSGTDWSRVDLDALRGHLVEMDLLFREARVARESLSDGMRYVVSGSEDVLAAARSVGAMHVRMLTSEQPSWQVRVEPRSADVVFEVRSADPGQVSKIRGVGFSGLLALGDHHARHHWMLATGGMQHHDAGAGAAHPHP